MNVSDMLDRFREFGDAPAIIDGDTTTSFRELLERVDTLRAHLAASGVTAGDVVAFEGEYSKTGCALLLAIGSMNAIAVPLSGRAYADLGDRLDIAEVDWLARETQGIVDLEHRIVARANPLLSALRTTGHPGVVIFTSASTGTSKAALHDLTRLLERYRRQRHAMRMIALLLFDHIGGLNTLFYCLGSGAALVVVAERTSDAICAAIQRHRIELLPATPTFLRMILMDGGHERYDLSSLRVISYGTEVMPESVLARLRKLLPDVTLHQLYGLTEVGVMRSLSTEPSTRWVRVGGDGFETKVENGTLRVRSPLAMLGYLNAPDPYDPDGWLDTHDRVEVRGDEVIILGRDTDLINVGGEKVYPAEIETVLLEMPNIVDATVFGAKSPVTGQVVAARLVLREPEDILELRRRVREFCEPRLARYKLPLKIEIVDGPDLSERYKKLRPR